MKHTKHYKNNIIDKSKNNVPIRVLYKKTGQPPETRIINNVFNLKKAIVKRNLEIIPYENLYIICNNRKSIPNSNPNIILTFSSIYGSLILVDIDKKEREFKGLSQEDIIWYSQDLMNKSSNNNNSKTTIKNCTEFHERNFEKDSNRKSINNIEQAMKNSIANIELALITMLRNGDKK